jgi:hypothetical protein
MESKGVTRWSKVPTTVAPTRTILSLTWPTVGGAVGGVGEGDLPVQRLAADLPLYSRGS